MSDPKKLLPCPFCGGEAYLEEILEYHNYVHCTNCECEKGRFQTYKKSQAIKAWNTRSDSGMGLDVALSFWKFFH